MSSVVYVFPPPHPTHLLTYVVLYICSAVAVYIDFTTTEQFVLHTYVRKPTYVFSSPYPLLLPCTSAISEPVGCVRDITVCSIVS